MYGYKSGVVASRGKTSHLTKRRVDSSRGKARLPLLSHLSRIPTVPRSVPFRVPTFSSCSLELSSSFLRPRFCVSCEYTHTQHAHPKKNTAEKERSHTAIGYGRKGVSHGPRTSPLSQIFLLLAMMTPLPATIMAWPDPYFLPRGPVVSCICFVEIEQPDPPDA